MLIFLYLTNIPWWEEIYVNKYEVLVANTSIQFFLYKEREMVRELYNSRALIHHDVFPKIQISSA